MVCEVQLLWIKRNSSEISAMLSTYAARLNGSREVSPDAVLPVVCQLVQAISICTFSVPRRTVV